MYHEAKGVVKLTCLHYITKTTTNKTAANKGMATFPLEALGMEQRHMIASKADAQHFRNVSEINPRNVEYISHRWWWWWGW